MYDSTGVSQRRTSMSLGLLLIIVLVIFLLGGFSGRFGATATVTAIAASA
jgi:hypothetical protein